MALLCILLGVALGTPATGPLAIVNAGIRQMEDGAPMPPGFTYVPGEILFFSFQIGGYQAGTDQKVHLSTHIEALDPGGVKIVEPIDSVVDTALAPEDKEWKPKVHHEIPLPPLGPSGTYKLAVRVKDDIAGSTVNKEFPFEVRGHDVASSPTLTVLNFHFYHGEDDRDPLARAAYRPGDTLWARFDITGYKLGDGNKVDVSYGIAVLAGDKVLFSQPEAAVEQTASFYPKRYIPGSMNLSLQPTIRPGEYAIVLSVKDAIGNQTFETRQTFSIE